MGFLLFITIGGILILAGALKLSCRSVLSVPSWLSVAALLAYGIPAVFFLLWALLAPSDASRFRLALRGLGFGAQTATQRFTIGGDPKKHDVWIPQLPRRQDISQARSRRRKTSNPELTAIGTLRLTSGTDTQPGNLTLIHPKMRGKYWPPPALLLTKSAGSYHSPFAVQLQDGDKLVYDGTEWLINMQQHMLGLCPPNGSLKNKITLDDPIILPRRSFCGAFSFKARTHPLNPILDANFTSPPLGLIYRKGTAIEMFILSSKVELWRDNQRLSVPAQQNVPVANGAGLYVFMLPRTKSKYDSSLTQDNQALYWGGLRDMRSFTVSTGRTHALLAYHTPTVTSLAWKDLKRLAIHKQATDAETPDKGARVRVSLAMGDWHITDQSLQFDKVSSKLGSESFAMLEFPESWSLANEQFGPWHSNQTITIASSEGRTKAIANTPFWIGGKLLAAFQFDLLTPPLSLALLALALVLAKMTAAMVLRFSVAHLFVAAMLEMLVTFRVILAYRAWIMPPNSEEAMRWALITWAILPWAFLLASMPANREKRQSVIKHMWHIINNGAIVVAGMIFSAVWCWHISGDGNLRILLLILHAAMAIAFLLPWSASAILAASRQTWANSYKFAKSGWMTVRQRIKAPQSVVNWREQVTTKVTQHWTIFVKSIDRPVQVVSKAGHWTYQRFLGTPEQLEAFRWLRFWTMWSLAFLGVRSVLIMFGMREAINLGTRLSISAIHLPLALGFEAYYLVSLWHRFKTNNRKMHAYDAIAILPIMLFVWLIPATLASDYGLLLQLPVFVLVCFGLMWTAWGQIPNGERYRGTRLGFSIFTYRMVFMVLILGAVTLWFDMNYHFSIKDWRYSNNYLRLMKAASPEQVSTIGGKSSEELMVMSSVLRTYTRDNFWGYGYAGSELSTHIKSTALSDHAASVLIAAEWGRIGVIGLGLMYVVGIYIGLLLAPWRSWYTNMFGNRRNLYLEIWMTAAGLAILTICFSSLYMLIANHDVLFFTGKNIYLFGLSSGSDVLESLVLFLLFASGATVASNVIANRD